MLLKSAFVVLISTVLLTEQQLTEDNPHDPKVCETSNEIFVCQDCNKIMVCLNNFPLLSIECTGGTPFCNDSPMGSYCAASPDPNKPQCKTNFQCTSEGYFPDPRSCQYYYICDPDLSSHHFECQPNYVYDASAKACKKQFHSKNCVVLDCSKTIGVWASYGRSKQYYAYCSNDNKDIIMFQCSDGSEFDGRQCVFKCRAEGKYQDSLDTTKYFECYYSGFVLKSRTQKCILNHIFDPKTKICIKNKSIK